MKMIFKLALLLALAVVSVGVFMYFREPVNIRGEKADFQLEAYQLMAEFRRDEGRASARYVDRVLEVSGVVSELQTIGNNINVLLTTGHKLSVVNCSFYPEEVNSVRSLHVGDKVIVKGKCTGMLDDVVLNNCSLVLYHEK